MTALRQFRTLAEAALHAKECTGSRCRPPVGGGTQDAGVDGSTRRTQNQLAIIPGTTHYNLMLVATEAATDYAKAFLAE
jgi:hypothetical protein